MEPVDKAVLINNLENNLDVAIEKTSPSNNNNIDSVPETIIASLHQQEDDDSDKREIKSLMAVYQQRGKDERGSKAQLEDDDEYDESLLHPIAFTRRQYHHQVEHVLSVASTIVVSDVGTDSSSYFLSSTFTEARALFSDPWKPDDDAKQFLTNDGHDNKSETKDDRGQHEVKSSSNDSKAVVEIPDHIPYIEEPKVEDKPLAAAEAKTNDEDRPKDAKLSGHDDSKLDHKSNYDDDKSNTDSKPDAKSPYGISPDSHKSSISAKKIQEKSSSSIRSS